MLSDVVEAPKTTLGYVEIIFGSLLLYSVYHVIYNLYFHPLAKFAGPRLAAISRLPYLNNLLNGSLPFKNLEYHNKYGGIVRIAPDELSLNTAEGWKDIYGQRVGKPEMKKDALFYGTTSSGSDSILGATRERHSALRRLVSHGFSEKALRLQEDLIQQYCDLLMKRLREGCKDGTKMVDMVPWYNFFTFDVIGDLAFGEAFGCLESGTYHLWVAAIFDNVKASSYFRALGYYPVIGQMLKPFVPKALVEKRKVHTQMTVDKVRKRQAQKTDRTDFLSGFLVEGADATDNEMISTSRTLIIAGSETTATLLCGITYLLMKNRKAYEKLVDEVRSAFASETDINFVNAGQLKYMLACLDEALRIYPPVPGAFPRNVPPGGDYIGDTFVPDNATVAVTQYAAYHSSDNFYLPDDFIPERWLDDERFKDDNKAAFQPFSVGPRNCVGRNLAYFEMRIVLARLLWNFDLVKLDPASENWADQNIYLFWEKPPLWVQLKPRVAETSA